MTEIEDDQSSTLAYANPGLGGKYLEAGGGGTGGSNAGNNALFAQAGANGSVSGVVPTGAAFVPLGTVYGQGGAGGAGETTAQGADGGAGAVLISY
jgi:hypothetical protein